MKLIQEEVSTEVEEVRLSRMVDMAKKGPVQGGSRRIAEGSPGQNFGGWSHIARLFLFLVQSVYDDLPCPSNLFTWGLADTPACQLCQKRGSLEHVLSCCPKALEEGQYHWRHDSYYVVLCRGLCTLVIFSCYFNLML